ncbi:MAG: hypothetical protein OEV49_13760 [candidate division Zixibacteria bacterium]|nr:hypothetical protein [candidate division Zixibacteria bacterium]MDH3937138.1 hypothetical protein [candidate division Zixibacteria bacterium]MDH4035347.1 hypothetical protein [candidate division Zixibacteria bacterium]
MRRQLPFALVFIFGLFMIFQFFVPHEKSEAAYEFLLDWIIVIGIFALALGIWSLFKVSVEKIKLGKEGAQYSYLTLVGLYLMVAFGFTQQTGEGWGLYFLWLVLCSACIVGLMRLRAATNSGEKRMWGMVSIGLLIAAVLVAIFDDAWAFFLYTPEGLENSMFRAFFDYVMMPILATMFSLLAFYIASAAYRAFRARNVLASLLLLAALLVMSRFNPFIPGAEYVAKASNWLMNVPNLAAQRAIVVGIGLGIVATALKVILGIERGYMGKG